MQADLLDELLATGTPVVVVVVSGRPYALGDMHGRAAGLVQAFMPGEEGGAAIAGVLSGRVQPSGKLPVQIPRHPGGQPSTYLQPPLGGAESAGISSIDPHAAVPVRLRRVVHHVRDRRPAAQRRDVPTDGEFEVSVRVRNAGSRAGDEVVQLYLHDLVAQVARPVKQLTGFARVALDAGRGRACGSTCTPTASRTPIASSTASSNRAMSRYWSGTRPPTCPCRATVRLTGPIRVVGHDRRLTTPVEYLPAAQPRGA